jgi:hypothetical protein
MRYRVYSGPKGSEDVSPMSKDKLLFKECSSVDDALSWARHVERGGRVPLLIEGDDGTRMDRRAIVNALRVGTREQVGGQPSA